MFESEMRSYSDLPEEIILDILSRLPAKSVGLCRCVSKPWRALLSRPEFIRSHLHQSKILRRESLLFLDSEDSLSFAHLSNAHHLFDTITLPQTKLIFADYPDPLSWVHASCDGLILAQGYQGKDFVLNPITGEIREVPRLQYRGNPSETFSLRWGLGYDPVNDDYKVVLIAYYGFELDVDKNEIEPDCTEMVVNVYSLKSGSWKRAEISPYDHSVGDEFDSGVFVDGRIHWLAGRTTDYTPVIVAFDLAEEKFCEMPPPCLIESDKILFFHLAVLGGCLCIYNDTEKYVWVMKEYGVPESWTKFTINDPESGEIRLSCLLGQEEVVLLRDDKKLAMYNVKEGTLKNIVVDDISEDPVARVSFVESLLSPHAWW